MDRPLLHRELIRRLRKSCWMMLACLLLLSVAFPFPQPARAAAASWTEETGLPTKNVLQTVRYGGGEWLAAGASATVIVSEDGTNWEREEPAGASNEWTDAVHDGQHWLLVGSGGKIYRSAGKTAASGWSSQTSNTDHDLYGIAYDGQGTYVAVGNGILLSSADGIEWDEQIFPGDAGETLFGVAYGNGQFVTVGSSGSLYTSANGMVWSEKNMSSSPLYGVHYGNGKFVATGSSSIYSSTDASSWSAATGTVTGEIYTVAYGNGKYVAAGGKGKLLVSPDAENWTDEESSGTSDDLYSIGYSAEQRQLVTVGGGDTAVLLTQEEPSEKLKRLVLSTGSLSPDFSASVFNYTVSVPETTTSMTITPSTQEKKATMVLRENEKSTPLANGTPSSAISIGPGSTTVQIEVTSSTGVKAVYQIVVNRGEPGTPPELTLTNSGIAENQPLLTEIGTLQTKGPNPGATYTYSLAAGDTDSFVIRGDKLLSNKIFDHETQRTYQITVVAHDSAGWSSNQVFTITIQDVDEPPVVRSSSKSGQAGGPISFAESDFASVFDDPEKADLQKIQIVQLPENGVLTLNGTAVVLNQEIPAADTPSLLYTPNLDWTGSDSFAWKGYDGTSYSDQAAEFSLAISQGNVLPTVKDFAKTGVVDQPIAFTAQDFVSAFVDADPGDSLKQVQIASLPASGSLQLDGGPVTSGQVIPASDLSKLSYVPESGWSGTVDFQWKGHDGTGYSAAAAVVTINIKKTVGNRPPTVVDKSLTGAEDTSLHFAESDFVYRDEDGDGLQTVRIESLPAHGKLTLDGRDVAAAEEIPVAGLSRLLFTPDPNWNGRTSFFWNGSDGQAYATVPARISMTITPVNDPPVARDVTLRLTQNQVKQGWLGASDVDGDALTYTLASSPAKGTVRIDSATGQFTFTPTRNATGSDSFTYVANDGALDSNRATVRVTISAVVVPPQPVYPPTISAISDQTIEQGGHTEDVAFQVSDFDDDPRTLAVTAYSDNQTLIPNEGIELGGSGANRTIRVTPAAGEHGTAAITVVVSDGKYSASETFRVTVTEVNHPPRALNGFLLAEKAELAKGVLQAKDEDGDPLTFELVRQASKGKVTLTNAETGAYTYTPKKGSSTISEDSFTFKVNDGKADSNVATVTISRKASNDATLASLRVSEGKLSPSFNYWRTSYAVKVAEEVNSIRVTPTTSHAAASVTVNGEEVESGASSGPIALKPGTNDIKVIVTAQNGARKTYKLTVEKAYKPITKIELEKHKLTMTEGDDPVTLAVRVEPEQDTENLLVWKSSRTSVVTVDKMGTLVARQSGTATITVSSLDGKVRDKAVVKVEAGKIVELTADTRMFVMRPKDTEEIRIFALYAQGTKRDVTEEARWSSKNRRVASASKGKIVANGQGSTLLTATFNDASVSFLVNVYDQPWVDEREVEVALEESADGVELRINGKLPDEEKLSVQVQIGKKSEDADMDDDGRSFSFARLFDERADLPRQMQLVVNADGSRKKEQIITLPIQLFDEGSVSVKKLSRRDDGNESSFRMTGDLYDDTAVMKVELMHDDEVIAAGTIKRGKFDIPSFAYDGGELVLRATSYTGYAQEWVVDMDDE